MKLLWITYLDETIASVKPTKVQLFSVFG